MSGDVRKQAPRSVTEPRPGFFLIRLVKGGPFVAARISHQNGVWWAEINGKPCGARHSDPLLAEKVFHVWLTARQEIDEAEYRRRLGLASQAGHPAAQPRKPIDLNALPPLY